MHFLRLKIVRLSLHCTSNPAVLSRLTSSMLIVSCFPVCSGDQPQPAPGDHRHENGGTGAVYTCTVGTVAVYSGGGGDTGGTLHGTVHMYSEHSTGSSNICPLSPTILMCRYNNTGWMDQANCIMTNFQLNISIMS